MSDPTNSDLVLGALLEARQRREPCVVATVIGFKGSTPRKPGAKMLVFADGRTQGTVGGGALEYEVINRARELCRGTAPELFERHLTHELGMCCGGSVIVLLEPQTYPPRLLLFGAGHVAEPLCQVAALAGFDVTVVDRRAELAVPERFAAARRILVEEPLDVMDALELEPDHTYVVIVTHDHGLDQEIAEAVLRRPFRFLGVIGSVRKREMFRKRLSAQGISDDLLARMRTPVGLEIEAETPAEIAVSVVAELIAVRRGSGHAAP